MSAMLTLMTEDLLSERVGKSLLSYVDKDAVFINLLGKKGRSYIEAKLKSLNAAAKAMKIVVIIDRDTPNDCPVKLIPKWVGGTRNPKLIVRFAEMETESWIMADAESLAKFLDISVARISQNPDSLSDPKREIVKLARHSRSRRIREGLCPTANSRSVVGPAYNITLEEFVINGWRPNIAIKNSPSLRRACIALRSLVQL